VEPYIDAFCFLRPAAFLASLMRRHSYFAPSSGALRKCPPGQHFLMISVTANFESIPLLRASAGYPSTYRAPPK